MLCGHKNRKFYKNKKWCQWVFALRNHTLFFNIHMFFVLEPFENPISEMVLFAYFHLNHRKTLWVHDFKNLSDSKNIDFEVRSVSLEVRSDAVLGVVLGWVWFCMSLDTRPALWKPMWFATKIERKEEKHVFLVNSRIFVKAITLW